MSDILLEKSGQFFDFSIENGDFKLTKGLDTALIMSLFIDKRATQGQVSDPARRRGNLIDELNEDQDYQLGSTLWLSDQARANQETLNRDIASANDALSWLILDGIAQNIQVTGASTNGTESIDVKIQRFDDENFNQQFVLWQNTDLA